MFSFITAVAGKTLIDSFAAGVCVGTAMSGD